MTESFDVAIVGAGPAGISAACLLAKKGVKTVVFERGEYPGPRTFRGGPLRPRPGPESPDFVSRNCPIERNIVESRLWYLAKEGGFSLSLPGPDLLPGEKI